MAAAAAAPHMKLKGSGAAAPACCCGGGGGGGTCCCWDAGAAAAGAAAGCCSVPRFRRVCRSAGRFCPKWPLPLRFSRECRSAATDEAGLLRPLAAGPACSSPAEAAAEAGPEVGVAELGVSLPPPKPVPASAAEQMKHLSAGRGAVLASRPALCVRAPCSDVECPQWLNSNTQPPSHQQRMRDRGSRPFRWQCCWW